MYRNKNVSLYKRKIKTRSAEDFSNIKDIEINSDNLSNDLKEHSNELNVITKGINFDFADRKVITNEVSKVMSLYDENRALKIKNCGDFIMFESGLVSKKTKLTFANFCRERMCPMCQWRKSRKLYSQICNVTDLLSERGNYRYLFLTLTVKNVSKDELDNSISHLFKSWTKLSRRKEFKNNILGYFRNLEVTYNLGRDDYHPHFHCLMIVKSSYFNGKNYIKHDKWQSLWKECADLDYNPQVNIKLVEQNKHRKDVSEVAKYAIKANDFLLNDNNKSAEIMKTMQIALKGRRLTTFSGLFSKAMKELKETEDIDNANLTDDRIIEIKDEPIAKTLFRWNNGIKLYQLQRIE